MIIYTKRRDPPFSATPARQRLAADTVKERTRLNRRQSGLGRELDRLTDFLIKGIGDVGRIDRLCKEARAEEQTMAAQLVSLAAHPTSNIDVHPAAIRRYFATVEELQGLIDRNSAYGDGETARVLRDFVKRVIIYPPQPGAEATIEVKRPLGSPDRLTRRSAERSVSED